MNSRMPNRALARSDVAPATTSSSSRSWRTGSPYWAGHQSFGFAIASCRSVGRADGDLARLAGGERDVLLEGDAGGAALQRAGDGRRRGVRREHLHRQLGPVEGGGQLRHDLRVAERHGTGGGEAHGPVEAHQLVGRHGVPVHEGDREVARLRGGDEDGEGVRAGLRGAGDVDLVDAVGAGRLRGVGDLLPVEPGVEAEVDAVEVQPEGLAGGLGRQGELRPVPPGHGEGAVRGHLDRSRSSCRWCRSCPGSSAGSSRSTGRGRCRPPPGPRRRSSARSRGASPRSRSRGARPPRRRPSPSPRTRWPSPRAARGARRPPRAALARRRGPRETRRPLRVDEDRADGRRTARWMHEASLPSRARLRPGANGRQ